MPTAPQSPSETRPSGPDAVAAAADKDPADITPAEKSSALDWFMSTAEEEVAWAYLPVNVAPAGHKERLVDFKIQVVDRDRIKELRKAAERTLPSGGTEIDEMEANLQIAVDGLLEPNVKGDASLRTVRGQAYMDPADALRARFAHKPGLIDQIAGQIVIISGYNDSDVKEVRAAGN